MLLGIVPRGHASTLRGAVHQALGCLSGCSSVESQAAARTQLADDVVASTSGRSAPFHLQPHAQQRVTSSRHLWAASGASAGQPHARGSSTRTPWIVSRGFASEAAAAPTSTPPPASQPPAPTSTSTLPPDSQPEYKVGHIYDAVVKSIRKGSVAVSLQPGGTEVRLRARDVSAHEITDLHKVFTPDEEIKVLVAGRSPGGTPHASTRLLETSPGLMLTDRTAVYAGAEQQGEAYRATGVEKDAQRQRLMDKLKVGDVVPAVVVSAVKRSARVQVDDGFRLSIPVTELKPLQMSDLKAGTRIELLVTDVRPDRRYPKFRLADPSPASSSTSPSTPTA